MDLETVYIYPDGSNYDEPPSYMSDDYLVRQTTLCEVCDTLLDISYDEPIASCKCGGQEWYL
jgi:hypothetical protein